MHQYLNYEENPEENLAFDEEDFEDEELLTKQFSSTRDRQIEKRAAHAKMKKLANKNHR